MAQKKSSHGTQDRKRISTELLVAFIGLAGTLGAAIISYMNTRSEILLPIGVTQTFEARQTPTNSRQSTPTQSVSPTPEFTQTAEPTNVTVVYNTANPPPQLVSGLPPAQKAIVQKAAETLIQAAQAFPLMVRDEFDNNDYGWPEANNIYNGGIECNTMIKDSAYVMNIHTANGPAYCFAGLARVAADFIMSIEQQVINESNSDIFILYRLVDTANFYNIAYNPQTQIFSAGITKDSQFKTIVAPTYLEEINTNGVNRVTLLAIGSSHVVYINDKLVTIYTDALLQQGQFQFQIHLQESNKEENLLIDHFDLRGN